MTESTAIEDYLTERRAFMVERQIAARGIRSARVLKAMNTVPRERFLPERLREFAYEDSALPIAEQQTISQPYIVAFMVDALALEGNECVLEVGTGSGYAAAVLAEIVRKVVSIERHKTLADNARNILQDLDYQNVSVIQGDGSQGLPEGAPFDAIIVTAGSPNVPDALKQQLAIGGRLVIPVGDVDGHQTLLRVTRISEQEFKQDYLSDVRFVPLIGESGWHESRAPSADASDGRSGYLSSERRLDASTLIAEAAEPFDDIDQLNLDRVLERIGDARVVLIGEASHGTSEFYRFRARLTQELINRKGFNFVAAEADWPDAARINHYVRDLKGLPGEWNAFSRFPSWMWRNQEVQTFVDWLYQHNQRIAKPDERVGFYGLDLYSLYTSIDAVLDYLEQVDPEAAKVARERYGCLTPYQADPATYARAALSKRFEECEEGVVAMLSDLLKRRLEYSTSDGDRFMDAVQNARLIASAERYYRSMYSGYSASWNLRDQHMFETLEALLVHHGSESKAIVWEHNSHIGDASATDMAVRGQLNVGQLCRQEFGDQAFLVGFGTHTGTVAAASDWDEPMEIKQVQPSLPGSWEKACHDTGIPSFTLGLRHPDNVHLKQQLSKVQLERAIGVIYRPETERASHYFRAKLAQQFDEYVWFDESHAVTPLNAEMVKGMPDTYPFGV